MGTNERLLGCLLGAAVGDTYEERARGGAKSLSSFLARRTASPCTAATEQVVVAALGLTDALRDGPDPQHIGSAISREILRWSRNDGMKRHRASLASLDAAKRLSSGAHWATVGRSEEAVEPLLRAVVVGVAFPPEEIVVPAVVTASVTHTHPDVLQAAVLLAHLVAAMVRGHCLDLTLLAAASAQALQAAPEGHVVASVLATIEHDHHSSDIADDLYGLLTDWQDSRTARAVSLAVATAARFAEAGSPQALQHVLETVAKHPEAPAGFGALTGALLGALWGDTMLPADVSDSVQHGQTLEALARVLYHRARSVPADLDDTLIDVREQPPTGVVANLFSHTPMQDATDHEWVMLDAMDSALSAGAPRVPSAANQHGIDLGAANEVLDSVLGVLAR